MIKLSSENKILIEQLHTKNYSIREIAQSMQVCSETVRLFLRAKRYGFSSTIDYLNSRAKEKGFFSHHEYQKSLLTKKGFKSINHYHNFLIEKRGFASMSEYRTYLARKRGFASESEYRSYMIRQRQNTIETQELSDLISKKLKELDKNQSWLAKEVGITKQAVNNYVKKKSVPREGVKNRIYSILEVPYPTLENYIEQNL